MINLPECLYGADYDVWPLKSDELCVNSSPSRIINSFSNVCTYHSLEDTSLFEIQHLQFTHKYILLIDSDVFHFPKLDNVIICIDCMHITMMTFGDALLNFK